MKIKNIDLNEPRVEYLVLPRGGNNIVIKAKAIYSFEEFDKIVEQPKPPTILLPGEIKSLDYNDKDFLNKLDHYSRLRLSWLVIQSLSATEDLTWEKVTNDPSTWNLWETELEEAGFSSIEKNKIFDLVQTACGMNQTKIDEATKSFLALMGKVLKE